ncbi:MAG: 2-dehydro-3-deoxygalactonokinase [Albidovulum sp.]|uniref:2-dehydro-3-deoxygalactonokinase n=1 Tax=Albidovulum sp. TaxID=1872424 RepID=UPI003C9DE292
MAEDTEEIGWIGVDWGSTHMRAFVIGPGGAVLAELNAAGGAGLSPEDFEPALLSLIGPYLTAGRVVPVIACGMVGSREGWHEVAYRSVPCEPVATGALVPVPVRDPRITVHIVPGLSQSDPADVLRGEETQIAGFLALNPGWDGVICLPGTHTKWAHLSAGEVVSFQSFMTGEIFALLSQRSVLRHSLVEGGWDDAAFAEAVEEAMTRPERLASRLYRIRTEDLLRGADPAAARARLSGFLIGAELAAARPYWLGQQVAIIGAPGLSSAYEGALKAQGVSPELMAGNAAALAGLARLAAGLDGVKIP